MPRDVSRLEKKAQRHPGFHHENSKLSLQIIVLPRTKRTLILNHKYWLKTYIAILERVCGQSKPCMCLMTKSPFVSGIQKSKAHISFCFAFGTMRPVRWWPCLPWLALCRPQPRRGKKSVPKLSGNLHSDTCTFFSSAIHSLEVLGSLLHASTRICNTINRIIKETNCIKDSSLRTLALENQNPSKVKLQSDSDCLWSDFCPIRKQVQEEPRQDKGVGRRIDDCIYWISLNLKWCFLSKVTFLMTSTFPIFTFKRTHHTFQTANSH